MAVIEIIIFGQIGGQIWKFTIEIKYWANLKSWHHSKSLQPDVSENLNDIYIERSWVEEVRNLTDGVGPDTP